MEGQQSQKQFYFSPQFSAIRKTILRHDRLWFMAGISMAFSESANAEGSAAIAEDLSRQSQDLKGHVASLMVIIGKVEGFGAETGDGPGAVPQIDGSVRMAAGDLLKDLNQCPLAHAGWSY